MKKKYHIILLVFLFSANFLFAQNDSKTVVIPCSEFHITRPLREIAAENPVDENKVYEKEESEDRENRKPQKFRYSVKDGPQYGNDPSVMQKEMGTIPGRAPITNWPGQNATGFRPFDPSGASGLTQYVQMINSTTFKVYNKVTGAVSLTATLGTLWSPATPNDGDPIVMYDKAANRWFLAQFGQTGNKMYIAISTTGDATGSYYTYTYTSPAFPDYLKFSVWHDGYYMTSNQGTQVVFCFERAAMLVGNAASRALYTTYSPPNASGFFVPLAGDAADGTLPAAGTPCPILSYSDNGWGASYIDAVNIYQMSVNWVPATPTGSITLAANLPAAAFDASYQAQWNDVSQPNTTQKLDGIGGTVMYRAQWKTWSGYNTVLLNWGVKISTTQRSIKWVELRQNQSTGVWSIYQEGIYTPDADTRWMGSIAMDNNGSIGLAYMKSNSTTVFPGLYYAGRRSCDPLGTLPVTETVVIAGTGSQTGTNRVGDYSHLALDPDGITFWHTSEYMGGSTGSSASRTQICSFQITPCGNAAGVSISQTSGTTPLCVGASATFTAVPFNGGTTPVYQWQVNGSNVGTNSTTYTTSSLTNGQIVTCIMTSNLVGVTGNPATSNAITMTVTSPLTPAVSIAITSGTNPTCPGSSVIFTATPTNGGAAPSYQWKVDGVNAGTNSSTFSTTSLTSGQVVSCVMTSNAACLAATTAASNNITMSLLTPVTPAVSIAITTGNNPTCLGAIVGFTASPVNGGSTPSYQWKVNGSNVGSNSPTYSSSTLTNGQAVTCVMTSNASCVSSTTAVSNGITMSLAAGVSPSVSISQTAGTNPQCIGAPASFSAAVSNGINPVYQWKVDGLNVGTNSSVYSSSALTNGQAVSCEINSTPVCPVPIFNTIGTGTGTNTTTADAAVAYPTHYSAGRQQYLIRASELTAIGFSAGNISSIGFSVAGTTGNPAVLNGYTIKIASTSSTVLTSTFLVAAFTTVFGPVNYTPLLNTQNTHSFAAPYAWDGISNIVIDICFSSAPATGTIAYQTNQTASSFVSCAYYRSNTSTTTCTRTTATGTASMRPNMTFAISSSSGIISTSNAITMNLNSAVVPAVTVSLTSGTNPQCLGESATFTAVPVNGGPTPSYQWQINGVNAGTNSPTFTTTTLGNGQTVTCVMTTSLGCANPVSAASNGITMNLSSPATPAVSIATGNNPLCTGSTATFTATPTNGGVSPSYQWKIGGTNVGTNSATFATNALVTGNVVSCVMTSNAACLSGNTAASNSITMTVSTGVTASITINAPNGSTVCAGNGISFTAAPVNGGPAPSYQWKRNTTNVGSNSTSFTTATVVTGDVITCVLTSSASCVVGSPATSNQIPVTVNPYVSVGVSISANPNTPICSGSSVTFTAVPVNGGNSPSYQWKKGAANVGTNSSTFTTSTLNNGDVITCVVVSNATCIGGSSSAVSNAVTMTVNPSVTTAPSVIVFDNCDGTSVLTASGYSGDLTWSDGGNNNPHTVTSGGSYSVYQSIGICQGPPSTPVNASPGGPVDDGNECTADVCDPLSGLTLHNPVPVDDNNACTFDACDSGTGIISHTALSVDDNNVCTTDGCDPVSGLSHTAVNVDDNNVCTTDACDPLSGPSHTAINVDDNNVCTIDACDPLSGPSHTAGNVDDNNVCTADACDPVSGPSHTLISYDDNNACTTDACDPVNGPSHTVISVDDNNACTTDACDPINGPSHTAVNVDDNNACTADACDPASGTSHILINFDDSNVCTTDACDPLTGQSHTLISYDDSNACTTDDCDPVSGLFHTPINIDDNNACTADACNPSTGAITHTASNVSDNNVCTSDACNTLTGAITHTPISVDDNNVCTTDGCDPVSGLSHTAVNVDDNNVCTTDACDPLTGPSHTAINVDDNNVCTIDACDPLSGLSHTAINVDDNNVCTADACDPVTGPSHVLISYDDNNACTLDGCDPVNGPSHTLISFDDNDACTTDACDPVNGPSHTAINVDDTNACTTDACDPSSGPSHTAINVDDNNVCTSDACDPVNGPSHTAINIDDNNACTADACDPLLGPSHAAISVDDSNICTTDACDPLTGPTHILINNDDNNLCTKDDCDSILGSSHNPVNIDDSNVCTTDACDPLTGTSHTLISVDDNDACTTDACDPVSGPSHAAVNVDDNNVCTTDGCDPLTGIYHTPSSCGIILNVKLYIEGFYSGNGLMQNGFDAFSNSVGCLNTDIVGISSNPLDVDTVMVTLMNSIAPYAAIESAKGILKTNGSLQVTFTTASAGSYYLKVNHRNSIETWSAAPVALNGISNYDFSDAANKAYGSNQDDLGDGSFAIFSGDIADAGNGLGGILNQDGIVESADFAEIENAVFYTYIGYTIADITGDGIVESSDYGLMSNAVSLTRYVIRP